ncbi:hypothetical protein GJ496_010558 [Pomphorhynchus laevis]|nr:hypothetical protein GJ496_010558 [Pomphorhynchus laevis]
MALSATRVLRRLWGKVVCDPVTEPCKVNYSDDCVVLCDASSITLCISLEIVERIAEGAAWLCKVNVFLRINDVELETAPSGISLAIK